MASSLHNRASAILLFLITGNYKVRRCGDHQLHNINNKSVKICQLVRKLKGNSTQTQHIHTHRLW
jgi:hypothetical protein